LNDDERDVMAEYNERILSPIREELHKQREQARKFGSAMCEARMHLDDVMRCLK
jgi:hypothetical protein